MLVEAYDADDAFVTDYLLDARNSLDAETGAKLESSYTLLNQLGRDLFRLGIAVDADN